MEFLTKLDESLPSILSWFEDHMNMYFAVILSLYTEMAFEIDLGVSQGPDYIIINNMTAGGLSTERSKALASTVLA